MEFIGASWVTRIIVPIGRFPLYCCSEDNFFFFFLSHWETGQIERVNLPNGDTQVLLLTDSQIHLHNLKVWLLNFSL